MDDDDLAGTRVLLIGGNRESAESIRDQLTAAGSSSVDLVPTLEHVAVHAVAAQPQIILSLGDTDAEAVRLRVDPLGLDGAPPVVAVADLVVDGQPLGATGLRRLRVVLDRHELRARVGALEVIVAGQALSSFRDIEATQLDALRRLAFAAEYRDDNSLEHTQRVGALAARLARRMGADDRTVALVRQAAPLHDLGKIAIPDSILLKPGRLEHEEFEVVKTHAVLGARVVADAESEVFNVAERIIRSHHERWDGDGYPDGLAGAKIPLVARVVHVADVFDVLVHERPYKDAWSVEDAAGEIRSHAGDQFDPDVVAAFDALGAGSWTAGLPSD